MASAQSSSSDQRCAVHPDRPSIGSCEDCGRSACLACAVPVRGRLLCRTCAARAVGTPGEEQPALPRPSSRPHVVAGALAIVAVLATIPPWHRAGSLSAALSAWFPSSELPVFVASVCLAASAAVILGSPLLRWGGRGPVVAGGALSAVAAGAIAFSLLRAPDFYAFTPAPFVALVAAAAATVLCALRVRRLSPLRNLRLRSGV